MSKRLFAGIVATFLLASPLLASAQAPGTGGEPASNQQLIALYTQLIHLLELIALYTQLIHLLEEEMGSLVATHGGAAPLANTPPTPASSNRSPSSTTSSITHLSWLDDFNKRAPGNGYTPGFGRGGGGGASASAPTPTPTPAPAPYVAKAVHFDGSSGLSFNSLAVWN
jgi:hypothetical protein